MSGFGRVIKPWLTFISGLDERLLLYWVEVFCLDPLPRSFLRGRLFGGRDLCFGCTGFIALVSSEVGCLMVAVVVVRLHRISFRSGAPLFLSLLAWSDTCLTVFFLGVLGFLLSIFWLFLCLFFWLLVFPPVGVVFSQGYAPLIFVQSTHIYKK